MFHESVAERGPERTRQKALFVISALAGLALTTGMVGLADIAGLSHVTIEVHSCEHRPAPAAA